MPSLTDSHTDLSGSIFTHSYKIIDDSVTPPTLLADRTGGNKLQIDLSALRRGDQVTADDTDADALFYDYLINGDGNLPGMLQAADINLNGFGS